MEGKPFSKEILDWILHIVVAMAIGVLIVTFVAQRAVVNKHSMEPTLFEGDNLIVEKITPKLGKYKRGDIVTISGASVELEEEAKTIIKRIIALENETIEIKNGKIFIDDVELEEDYTSGMLTLPANPEYRRCELGEGEVYVLGDNRGNSKDSRNIGPISVEKIQGKAIFRIYPFNKIGVLK